MANQIFTTKIALVNKTTSEWGIESTIPVKGCPCVEWTTEGKPKIKIGDGVNTFNDLKYVSDEITMEIIVAALGFTPADSAKIGAANGIASLDEGGKVPAAQLPSYVDDVIEVDTIETAPETGETGKIYVDISTGKCYRWTGTIYTEISTSDVVTASDNNGYIKVNGKDIKVFEQEQADWNETDENSKAFIKNKPIIPAGAIVDSSLSEESVNAVQNKVIAAELKNKLSLNDTLILNCIL